MNKVYLYPNTRDSLPDAISDMQIYSELEKNRFFSVAFSSFGVASETDETGTSVHADDTNLKCTAVAGTLTIGTGYAITSGLHWLYAAPTDTRTFTEGVDYNYGDTIYLKHAVIQSRQKEQAKGFYLNIYGSGFLYTRDTDTWELTTTDPGVSGVVLGSVAAGDVVTDLRANNLLKLDHTLIDDTNIPKKDREAEFQMNVILQSGLVMKDLSTGYEMTISPVIGLPSDIDFTGIEFHNTISGAHTHGTNNSNLTELNSLGERGTEVELFLDSGVVGSDYYLNNNNLRSVTSHPLYGLLQAGVIDYADGHGERQVLTRKIASVPNVPSGVAFSLIEERAPEYATRQLRDAMRAHNIKEQEVVFNLSASAGLTSFRGSVTSYAAASGYTTSSGLQTNAYIMSEASGLISAGYIDDYDDVFLDEDNEAKTVAEVSAQINQVVGTKETEKDIIDADIVSLSKEVLGKAARMKVRPNAVINKKYHARVSWTEPELVDLEDIIGYDVRIYQYNADAADPGAVTPAELNSTYAPDVISTRTESTPRRRLQLTSISTTKSITAVPADLTDSDDAAAWTSQRRLPISVVDYAALSPIVGDYVTINDVSEGTTEPRLLVKHGTDTGISQPYLQFAEGPELTVGLGDTIDLARPSYDTTTDNTSILFPIDIDQAYIAYVRAVNEHNIVSNWSTAVYQTTNNLPDSKGVILISGVQEDSEYLEQINRIESDQLTKKFENQLVNLQRQIDAGPDAVTIANLVQSVNNLA